MSTQNVSQFPKTIMINPEVRQLSKIEKKKIEDEIDEELLDHWFKAAFPGVFLAITSAIVFFIFFYKRMDIIVLSLWFIGLCLVNVIIASLNFLYKKHKALLAIKQWDFILSTLVVITTAFWGATILFNPGDLTQQFILFVSLFVAAACFSLITVGRFWVCLISVFFILGPVAYWFFSKQEFYYMIGGGVILIYIAFISGMNLRSTQWLIRSLRLSKMLASFTHQANYDLLTDLPNQRLLTQYIDDTISKVKKTHQNFALVCFSINRLEVFNNSLGYHAGDLVIYSVAKRFENELHELSQTDKRIRILTKPRPESFVMLISPADVEELNKEINRLFSTLNKPFHLGDRESRLTASVGITIFPQDSDDAEKLLGNTYAAMFEARSKGGNQVSYYKSTMTSNAPKILEYENDLHKALERKQFEVHYQPIVNLQEGIISGMEALLRWKHPKRGYIPPLDFISLAEETGLILPISEWVFEQAAIQTLAWQNMGFEALKIAVNLSPKQLRQGDLANTIDKILEKTKLSPKNLELELTETAILDESLSPLINEISKKGIALSIDDFGTGYSGLSYLKHFHVDKIKIDKSFIDDVVNSSDSAAIVTAMLAMSKELGIKTLAEGVENKEQLKFLKQRNCQYIQGYYFSKPLDAAAFEALLHKGIADKL